MPNYGSIDPDTTPTPVVTGGHGGHGGNDNNNSLTSRTRLLPRPVTPPTRPSTSTSTATSTCSTLSPSNSAVVLSHSSLSKPLESHESEREWGSRAPSVHSWLAETLQAPYTTPFLLTVTFSTAILDSMTYNRFETFASNQTGNTVFLALAAMHAGQRKLTLTLTSFAGFVGSGLVFGQLGAYFGHRRRAWILTSLIFQITVLSMFTALVSPNLHPDFEANGRYEWFLMLLAAVQSGPQVTMGTNIDNLMPTAMLTSPIAGLVSDPDLFSLRRAPTRDKRLVYVLTFIVGAHVGLASDMFLSQWSTAIIALCLKAIAIVIAVKIPGTRTSVLRKQQEDALAHAQPPLQGLPQVPVP